MPVRRLAPPCNTQPEARSARGIRRKNDTEEYRRNLENRKRQSSPASKTHKRLPGPHHRRGGLTQSDWNDAMIKCDYAKLDSNTRVE